MIYLAIYLLIAHCSADIFQFKTLKPKLYPFLHAFSGIKDDSRINATEQQDDSDERLDPKQWAWIVVVLSAQYDYHQMHTSYQTICLGILITKSDVLTTCSCVRDERPNDGSNRTKRSTDEEQFNSNRNLNLLVKPKTTIVEWEQMMREVTHVQYHESCYKCNGSTSYNNLALLTVEIFDIIHGVIETLPRQFYIPDDKNEIFRNSLYEKCFIVVMDTKTPIQTDSRLAPLPLSRRDFTPWDFPSPRNYIHTKIIVGRSKLTLANLGSRYPGSPLFCQDKRKQAVPMGVYMGLACPETRVKVEDLKQNCSKRVSECQDCFQRPLDYHIDYKEEDCHDNAFEIVLRFDNLGKWVDEDTFEVLDKLVVPYKKSPSCHHAFCTWNIFIFILLILHEHVF